MYDHELVREILLQILEATRKIERRFASIRSPDDFLANEDGIENQMAFA